MIHRKMLFICIHTKICTYINKGISLYFLTFFFFPSSFPFLLRFFLWGRVGAGWATLHLNKDLDCWFPLEGFRLFGSLHCSISTGHHKIHILYHIWMENSDSASGFSGFIFSIAETGNLLMDG